MDSENVISNVLKNAHSAVDNSNIQITPSIIDYAVSSRAKRDFALKRFYTRDVREHHQEGRIYIHTLDNPFKPYCNGIDARVFLLDGLRFPHCTSRPARHFSSAVYQSMAYMFYSQQFFSGAQAVDYYNWFLAPFVRYDRLEYKEVRQVIQGLIYQLNQANRTGAQSAFTNIGLRIKCPSYLGDKKIIWSGKKRKDTYGSFDREARMIYRAFIEIAAGGDGRNAPFTFPIITTAITKKFDFDDPLFELSLMAASATGAPYFLNLSAPYLDEKYVHAMCCRLLVKHSGGVWMAGGIGTGSNKVVTINLPRLAIISRGEEYFFKLLEKEMRIARTALLQSNEVIKKSLEKWRILPLLKMKTIEGIPYYDFRERRLTFGMVGLNECLLNLIGADITSKEGQENGFKIMKFMEVLSEEFSKKDGIVYTLEQTPAETASHRLATKDSKDFSKANLQGRHGFYYYTNSTHVPYNKDIPLLEKASIESRFHPLFNGGAISHFWIGDSMPPVSSMKNIAKKLSSSDLAYFTFSPDFSICMNDHLSRGKRKTCLTCNSRIKEHISRIVGFFTRTSNWNPGKKEEYEERYRYNIR